METHTFDYAYHKFTFNEIQCNFLCGGVEVNVIKKYLYYINQRIALYTEFL
jgi:hypothetical protein